MTSIKYNIYQPVPSHTGIYLPEQKWCFHTKKKNNTYILWEAFKKLSTDAHHGTMGSSSYITEFLW